MQTLKTQEPIYTTTSQQTDLIHVTYYTDPLCCWSWAFEKEWQKLQNAFNETIVWRYCMGGLLPGWNNFHDTVNSISRPAQMGPMWMHAASLTGTSIENGIWVKDPPASSYPACIAVKCAELQSAAAGEKYLYLLRKACMVEGRNIAKPEVLLNVAATLAKDKSLFFDADIFRQHLYGNDGKEAFNKDLREVRYYGINRFPSLVFKNQLGKAILLTGYNTYESLCNILCEFIDEND
jgi:putative protein-disulfide isomerase